MPKDWERAVAVQLVRLNPFVLSLTIRGFTLNEPNGRVRETQDGHRQYQNRMNPSLDQYTRQ